MAELDDVMKEIGEMENSITLTTEDGERVTFYVLEETKLGGEDYLLVTDSKEEDGECYLLKDTSGPEDSEASYEFVEDDFQLDYLSNVFNELMRDLGVEIEA